MFSALLNAPVPRLTPGDLFAPPVRRGGCLHFVTRSFLDRKIFPPIFRGPRRKVGSVLFPHRQNLTNVEETFILMAYFFMDLKK